MKPDDLANNCARKNHSGTISCKLDHIGRHISRAFVARLSRHCWVGTRAVEVEAGVAATTSNLLEPVGPVTAVSRRPRQEAGEICGLSLNLNNSLMRVS